MELVLASGSAGKLIELRDLLGGSGLTLRAQSEFDVRDAEETGATFVENALLKARHAARLTGRAAWWLPRWLDRALPEVRFAHD